MREKVYSYTFYTLVAASVVAMQFGVTTWKGTSIVFCYGLLGYLFLYPFLVEYSVDDQKDKSS